VSLPGVGAFSRVLGVLALGVAVLTTLVEGGIRKPGGIFWTAIGFTGWSALSLLWTISYDDTFVRALTFAQLLGSVWIVQEFARTRERQQSLMVAFCLGAFVPMYDLIKNFNANQEISMAGRFSASGLNADDLGMTLVIGIPIAWHLILTERGMIRAAMVTFFTLAPLGVLLTGTRTAFIAGIVALSIVPLTLPRPRIRALCLAAVLMTAVALTTAVVVPPATWDRMLTIGKEIRGGTMTGRTEIWKAGMSVIPESPILGVGAGAFPAAVEPLLHKRHAPHNLVLAVLVEEGVIGLLFLVGLLGACALAIVGLPPNERKLWAALMLAWLVGAMAINWEHRKITWLLFGLLAARHALERSRARSFDLRGHLAPRARPVLVSRRATSDLVPQAAGRSAHPDRRAPAHNTYR
jgi:O-antigen ligase